MPSVATPTRSRRWPVGLAALLVVWIVAARYWMGDAEPIRPIEAMAGRRTLSILGVVMALGWSFGALRTKRRVGRVFFRAWGPQQTPLLSTTWLRTAVLGVVCVWGTFNYYNFNADVAKGTGDKYDITFYYLNSKYFDELGYDRLYEAMLVADDEGPGHLDYVWQYRDLNTYELVTRKKILTRERAAAVRSAFSETRWEAFKHDMAFFSDKRGRGNLKYFFRDHGFNPPPTWTVVGAQVSERVPVEDLKVAASVDMVLVGTTFVVAAWAWGLDAALFGVLLFVCTFGGRWPILGQVLLRFDWLAGLICGAAFLRRGRHGLAGACLAYAACVRIFPAAFFLTPIAAVAGYVWRDRKIPGQWVRFIVGAGAMTLGLVGAAIAAYGLDAMLQSIANLSLHNSPKSYSSWRMGLGDALVYQGDRWWQLLKADGGIPARAELVASIQPWPKVAAVAVALFVGQHVFRRPERAQALLHLGWIPIFCYATPNFTYYAFRVLLVIAHASRPGRTRHAAGLALLFALEGFVTHAAAEGSIPYTMTSLGSVGLLFYACLSLVWVGLETTDRSGATKVRRALERHPTAVATVATVAILVVFSGYWRRGELPETTARFAADEVDHPVRRGASIRSGNPMQVDAPGFVVDLDGVQHARRMEMTFDGDDRYRVEFRLGDERTGWREVASGGRGRRGRYARRRFGVPESASEAGFDSIRVIPLKGDKNFVVGHVRVLSDRR